MAAPAEWFTSARFGLFVHWGTYSAQGWEPSWPLVGGVPVFPHCQDVPADDYHATAGAFAPPPDAARDWARRARAAGMRYAVLTTKHHDGYALFPSAHSDHGVGRFLPGRDLVGEFVDACRAEDLRIGLYFSLSDWHHPDYPAFTDAMRPYDLFRLPRSAPEAWERFLADQRGQLTDLLTRYGPIDLLWFDGGWERRPGEWRSDELEAMLRSLAPEVVINDRLPGVGDYDTPEQGVPHRRPARPWETCMTMGESWGPLADDGPRKSVRTLLTVLADVAAGGGNLLLNVSPLGDGSLPEWQAERLDAIAGWMATHASAVHDTTPGLAAWQFHGPTTRRPHGDGQRVHLFCPMRPQETVVLRGVPGRHVTAVRALGSDTPLHWEPRLSAVDRILDHPEVVCDVVVDTPDEALDPLLTVIEVTFDVPLPPVDGDR
jgi:alpha-L-fucosidase